MSLQNQPLTFVANLMSFGISEVASKCARILVVVAMARALDLVQIGIVAAAIAAGDILKSFTENGVGQRIIAASDRNLDAICATAHRLFWVWTVGLFCAQLMIATVVYLFGGSIFLSGLIALMGVEYLFMPAGLVQVALAMRAGKLKQIAAIGGLQNVGANLMSIALLTVWPSAIALILPRILSAPIWLVAVRRLNPWTKPHNTPFAPLMPFVQYGWAVLGVEVVKAMRLQADKLVVGLTLGAETLGLYFIAFNAGLSLSNAFTTAFSTVLFPRLAQSRDRLASLRQSLLVGVGLIVPLVTLQALLVPVYMPFLLGPGWGEIELLVKILCLVAIPMTFWATAAGWLRAKGRPQTELWITSVLAIAVIVNALVLGPFGLLPLTIGYAVITTIVTLAAAIVALRAAFHSSNFVVTI